MCLTLPSRVIHCLGAITFIDEMKGLAVLPILFRTRHLRLTEQPLSIWAFLLPQDTQSLWKNDGVVIVGESFDNDVVRPQGKTKRH